MLDAAKLRIIVGLGGALIGFVGLCCLFAAITIALAYWLGWIEATLIVGVALLAISVACIYYCIRPQKSAVSEIENIETATAEALADLPYDAVQSMIRKRPFAAVAIAMIAGYVGVKDPDEIVKNMQRLVFAII